MSATAAHTFAQALSDATEAGQILNVSNLDAKTGLGAVARPTSAGLLVVDEWPHIASNNSAAYARAVKLLGADYAHLSEEFIAAHGAVKKPAAAKAKSPAKPKVVKATKAKSPAKPRATKAKSPAKPRTTKAKSPAKPRATKAKSPAKPRVRKVAKKAPRGLGKAVIAAPVIQHLVSASSIPANQVYRRPPMVLAGAVSPRKRVVARKANVGVVPVVAGSRLASPVRVVPL